MQKVGPQLLSSVLVDNEDRGNATLDEIFHRQLQFAEYDDSGYYLILPNFVIANELLLFSEVRFLSNFITYISAENFNDLFCVRRRSPCVSERKRL